MRSLKRASDWNQCAGPICVPRGVGPLMASLASDFFALLLPLTSLPWSCAGPLSFRCPAPVLVTMANSSRHQCETSRTHADHDPERPVLSCAFSMRLDASLGPARPKGLGLAKR